MGEVRSGANILGGFHITSPRVALTHVWPEISMASPDVDYRPSEPASWHGHPFGCAPGFACGFAGQAGQAWP